MLKLEDLHAYYGKSHILHGVDMQVGEGEIVSLLGRNGSGRSTTVKAIMGLVARPGLGAVARTQEILGQQAFEIAHRGIGYVPENRDIFPKLTVHQNLHARREARPGQAALVLRRHVPHVPAPEGARSTPRPACCRAASSRC